MNEDASTSRTDQPGWIIEGINQVPVLYWSEKVGRDHGSPTGGWTADRSQATVMTEQRADQLLDGPLITFVTMTKVSPA